MSSKRFGNMMISRDGQATVAFAFLTSFIKDRIKEGEGAVILDIGSHSGFTVNWFAKHFPEAKIHAFEPEDTCYSALKSSVSSEKIELHKLAVSNEDGSSDFYVVVKPKDPEYKSASNSLVGSSVTDRFPNYKIKTANTISLNTFCKPFDKIDFMKMNCEGGEYLVFNGDLSFLDKVQILSISFHGKSPEFLTDRYAEIRKYAVSSLKKKGFSLVEGFNEPTEKHHSSALWAKL